MDDRVVVCTLMSTVLSFWFPVAIPYTLVYNSVTQQAAFTLEALRLLIEVYGLVFLAFVKESLDIILTVKL